MPKISRNAVENTIKRHCPHITAGDLRRATKRHMRRNGSELPSHEDALLLVKAITYADITGERAARNVDKERAA